MRSVWKATGLVLKTISFNSRKQTAVSPFNWIPPPLSLMYFSIFLSHFCTLPEGFFLGVPQLCRYSALDGLHAFKWWSTWAWGKERSHTKQDQVNREVVAVWQGSSLSETAGYSGCYEPVHCCGEAVTICPATKACGEKKMQWLQKANIIYILPRYVRICLSLFHPQHTQSVTLQTDLVCNGIWSKA